VAALAPVVLAAAEAGDDVAGSITWEAVEGLVESLAGGDTRIA